MDAEIIRNYCLAMPDAIEQMPFGPNVLVFKVNTKMFCLLALDEIPTTINVKCDPEVAIELREKYNSVIPGYHMNKKYWNTIIIDGSIPSKLIKQFIDDSYNLIRQKAKKK
jgi:predicted DNA-binding protein (MmcQ/YjbR family)